MTSAFENEATALTETFKYESKLQSYIVKWRSIGDASLPPVIFIHGTPWSSRVWVPFALALSRQFHVYLFDRPGFGDSPDETPLPDTPAPSNDVKKFDSDLLRQAEVFSALFKSWQPQWGGRKPQVIAHDNAGLISLRAFLQFQCEYASLCVIDVVALGPWGQSLFKAIGDNPQLFTQLPTAAFEGILEGYIRQAAFHELPRQIMEMLKAPWLREGGREGFIRELCQANCRHTEDIEERYGQVGSQIPVKVVWGANDAWLPVEMAHRLGNALKAQEIVTIEGGGHLLMYDQGPQLGIELGRWLTTVDLKLK